MQSSSNLNAVYSSLRMKRRYEVWFLRLGLVDGSGAWWFRYLLMNPGRDGCTTLNAAPLQLWATWFPRDGAPETLIQHFPKEQLVLSGRGNPDLEFRVGGNFIHADACRGHIRMQGHDVAWDLQYRSQFHNVLSNKGWIGFSKTPHSDAVFSGAITFDGTVVRGESLGTGLQGHNCGVRHRHFWTWTHAYLPGVDGSVSTLEALFYEMPLGLTFRKAILWHRGQARVFRRLRELERDDAGMRWSIVGQDNQGATLEARMEGPKASTHRLPYVRTDCSGSFEVANNSLAHAHVRLLVPAREPTELTTDAGAVLEMTGTPR
jgi:hypothetical protein